MNHQENAEGEKNDETLGEFERGDGAQNLNAGPVPRLSGFDCGTPHVTHFYHYLPGCNNNCSAGEKIRVRMRSVLTSEVSPEAAKIIAKTTNW